MNNTFSSESWIKVITFLINCSTMFWPGRKKRYTENEIESSNSHGEMFGVSQSIMLVQQYYYMETQKSPIKGKLRNAITDILNGKRIEPNKQYLNLIGLQCITLLWNAPEIERLIDNILKLNNVSLENKEKI